MSHCTKFEFTYTDEETVVKAFTKLGLASETALVCEFNSDFSKQVLSKLGYMGKRQYRSICASAKNGFNIFLCKIEDNLYKLFIEKGSIVPGDEVTMENLASKFQKAYVGVAIDETMRRIEASGVPARVKELSESFEIEFGANYEYSIHVTFSGDQIKEEVSGVKGNLCTKLTEELERLLASPSADLMTEWKPEYTVTHEDQTLQILSANL